MRTRREYTHKTKLVDKIVMLHIRPESDGWYLYADEILWAGPFDFEDQAADWAHWCHSPPLEALGISGPAPDTLPDVSDKVSEWKKVPGK